MDGAPTEGIFVAYTYSKAIDNGPAPFNLGSNNQRPQDPFNLAAERAVSANDIRHNLVASFIYELPIGRGKHLWELQVELPTQSWEVGKFVAVLGKALAADPAIAQKVIPDRIHPGAAGHLLMATELLKAWHAPALVYAVELDAKGKSRRACGKYEGQCTQVRRGNFMDSER
jgi:hypothetical protein